MKTILCFALLLCCAFKVQEDKSPDDIIGVWANESNKGRIVIYKEKGVYFGKIIWLFKPNDTDGKPKLDKNNPNTEVRSKPLLGLVMLKNFRYEDGEWTGGKIYNPDDGKEYKAYMKLKDSKTLSVRGYIGFSWIGKTELFHRVQ